MPKQPTYKVLKGPYKGMRCSVVERRNRVTLVRLSTGEYQEIDSGLLQRVRAQLGFIHIGPRTGMWCVIVDQTKNMVVVQFDGARHTLSKDFVKPWRHGQPRPSNVVVHKDSAENVIAGRGVVVSEFFDSGYSRRLPWTDRPEAAALLDAVADPDRGFDAIVVGEFERAFYGDQLQWLAGHRGERGGDLLQVGFDVGGGCPGAGAVGVAGVGAGDCVAEVTFCSGQGGVAQPVAGNALYRGRRVGCRGCRRGGRRSRYAVGATTRRG